MSRTDLRDADLRGADLSRADLRGADLSDADLSDADLSDADLSGADLRGADVPLVPDLDRKIHAAVCGAGAPGRLDMGVWHDESCQTTHCRAGWAIHLAGPAGYKLEKEIGPAAAGALIYHKSTGRIPDFYCGTAEALADICALAKRSE